MSSQPTASSPLPSSHPTTPDRSASQDPSSYKCSCGAGNGTGDYIQCDNEKCPVGWYHWECVHVTEEPIGTWLCPSCSPSAAFYVKQLVKKPAPSPIVPDFEGNAGPSVAKGKELKQGPLVSTAGKAATPTTRREKETIPEAGDIKTAKKGTAIKKPAAQKLAPEKPARKPKPKQKWVGWVEMSSDGEEDFKQAVDAQWDVEDSVLRKRRRGSKAVDEEDETEQSPEVGSHSRARGKKQVVEDEEDDDEPEHEQEDEEDAASNSMYQEEEDEEDIEDSEMQMYPGDEEDHDQAATSSSDEASLGHEPSVEDEDPHSAEDSEDSMDIDQESSSSSDSAAEASNPSHTHKEDSDDSTVVDDLDVAARGSDDETSSNQPRSRASLAASSSSHSDHHPAPSSPMLDDDDEEDATTPPNSGSQASSASEDSMEIDADSEHQEHQPPHTSTPAAETVNLAPRYQRQGNPWVEYPESAIRSTLPRLA